MNTESEVPNPILAMSAEQLCAHLLRVLFRSCGAALNREDRALVREAFFFSFEAHRTHVRKSGEPYILHPVEVALILCDEIGYMDRTAIIAALIHDVVEDTPYELPEIGRRFGPQVSRLVDGLTKISTLADPTSSRKAETYRKMLLTMSDDIRVALIKIADRVHNMRTLASMKQDKKIKIATETMYLYAPLAHRLGLYQLKSELEDLSLQVLEPDVFTTIQQQLKDSRRERVRFVKEFIEPLKGVIAEKGYNVAISGRVKSINSIYSKMKRQQIEFDDVQDVFAIRIVIDLPEDDRDREVIACWEIYHLLTKMYKPDDTRLRNWLTTPKSNGYEALHTTVRTDHGRPVEIQIRTKRMDHQAEKGVAAHWKYKEGANAGNGEEMFERWLLRIRNQLENTHLQGADLMSELKSNIESEPIFVFTHEGEMLALPPGSTVLDFAFEALKEQGNHCIGAKVNHRLRPIDFELKNGDQVEALTSDKQLPQRDWLRKVRTNHAYNLISTYLDEKARHYKESGRRFFEQYARRFGISYDHALVRELMDKMQLQHIEDFYYMIGARRIETQVIREFIEEKMEMIRELQNYTERDQLEGDDPRLFSRIASKARGVDSDSLMVDGSVNLDSTRFASCCNPIAGDDIVGFEIDGQYQIHRTTCSQAIELMTYRDTPMVNVKWINHANRNDVTFLTGVEFAGADRSGMLADIVRVISEKHKTYIRSITIDTFDALFQGTIKLYVRNTMELETIMRDLKSLSQMVTVKRIQA